MRSKWLDYCSQSTALRQTETGGFRLTEAGGKRKLLAVEDDVVHENRLKTGSQFPVPGSQRKSWVGYNVRHFLILAEAP